MPLVSAGMAWITASPKGIHVSCPGMEAHSPGLSSGHRSESSPMRYKKPWQESLRDRRKH